MYITPKKNHVLLKVGTKGNVILCFVCDEELKRQLKDFAVGDYINLSGNVQSSRFKDSFSYNVFVEKIVPKKYSDEGFYNQFWLSGTVENIKELTDCMRIVVRTKDEHRTSYVPVVFYHPDVRRLNYEIGEKITTGGSIQSVRKKTSQGEYIYYQNYVGSLRLTG